MIRQFILLFTALCTVHFCYAKEAKFSVDVVPVLKQDKLNYNLLKSFEVWEYFSVYESTINNKETGKLLKYKTYNCRTNRHFVMIKMDCSVEKSRILSVTFTRVPLDCCHGPQKIVKMKNDFTITVEDYKRAPTSDLKEIFEKALKKK